MRKTICNNFAPIWQDSDVEGVRAVAAKVMTSHLGVKCNQVIHCWRGSFFSYIMNKGGALLSIKLL